MDTYLGPLPASLPANVEKRIRTYRPRSLTSAQWTTGRKGVVTLVAACPPDDEADARALLYSAVTLMSWAAPRAGVWDLHELLRGPWVQRFASDWPQRHQHSDNTLRNHVAALHRLQRTANGEDGSRRKRRLDRAPKRTSPPYGPIECGALRTAAAAAPSDISDTIVHVLDLAGRGIAVSGGHVPGVSDEAWQRARDWVKVHRLPPLDADQFRRMWVHQVASQHRLIRAMQLGASPDELDGVREHLPHGDPASVRRALRGF